MAQPPEVLLSIRDLKAKGFTAAEIATTTGVPLRTVTRHLATMKARPLTILPKAADVVLAEAEARKVKRRLLPIAEATIRQAMLAARTVVIEARRQAKEARAKGEDVNVRELAGAAISGIQAVKLLHDMSAVDMAAIGEAEEGQSTKRATIDELIAAAQRKAKDTRAAS